MYKIEVHHTLRRIIRLFNQFGVWRNEEESDFRKSFMRLFYLLEFWSLIIFFLICAIRCDDKNQQIFLVELAINANVMLLKLWFILYRKDEILQFFYDPIVEHRITDYDEWLEVSKKIKKLMKFIKFYSSIIIVGVFGMVIVTLPIFTNDKILPLFISFDWESDYEGILYWIAFLYTAIGCLCFVVYNFVIVLIWYIMFNYAIEYQVLGNQFRRLGNETKGTRQKTARNSFHQDLIGLIEAQKKLFYTVERFRLCFSTLFLAEIFTGAISICGSTYNLAYGTLDNLFQMAYFISFLTYVFFDIFVIMYLANEITLESDRLSYCLFESNWTEQPQATKKCIITMCEMIKKPQQLVVFIYPMNLEKFSSIANGAYSMFNVLKSFNK